VVLVLLSASVQAERFSVLVYHGANPPYNYLEKGKQAGIFRDIFDLIAAQTGHEFEFIALSVARGQRLFEAGEIDIEPGVNPSWRQHSKVPGIYSVHYAFSREIVLGREGARPHTSPRSFYHQLIGVVRGYSYGAFERHFGPDKIVVYDNISEKKLLAQLAYARLDYILIGDVVAAYYIAKYPEYRGFTEIYEVSKLPVSMRMQPKHTKLKAEINRALRYLVEQGKIAQVYSKYGIMMPSVTYNMPVPLIDGSVP
jgi:polar amino acid transport system substrate-binding protein